MFLYTTLLAIASVVVAIIFIARTKRKEGVEYGRLDKAGRITNVFLSLSYVCASPICLFIGMISYPAHDGFLGFIGWVASIIAASASLPCFVGIGASVALRRIGKSRLSFALQFAGLVGIAITVLIFVLFYGNLLSSIN